MGDVEQCHNIWNLAKLKYRIKIPYIDIWTISNTKPSESISKFSGLALISGTICNFDIKGLYFNIEVGMLLYWSTQKCRNIDIKGPSILKYHISKNLRYWSSNSYIDIEESSISKFELGPSSRAAAPARAGLLIAIAGCSSVLCTYCSVTFSLQVSVYPSVPAAAVPGCRRGGVPGKLGRGRPSACSSAAAVSAQKRDQVLHGFL